MKVKHPINCIMCGGSGILFTHQDYSVDVEHCDVCKRFDSDLDALKYLTALTKLEVQLDRDMHLSLSEWFFAHC